MLYFRQEKASNSISSCPVHGTLATIFVQKGHMIGFLSHMISLWFPGGAPWGEGISQFSQISEKNQPYMAISSMQMILVKLYWNTENSCWGQCPLVGEKCGMIHLTQICQNHSLDGAINREIPASEVSLFWDTNLIVYDITTIGTQGPTSQIYEVALAPSGPASAKLAGPTHGLACV